MSDKGFFSLWMESTNLDESRAGRRTVDWDAKPSPYKNYPEAQRVRLPRGGELAVEPHDLWAAMHTRRSRRKLTGSVSLEETGALIWAAQGVTARQGPYLLRTAPSAGALYPFETYLFYRDVEGLGTGCAHLDVASFELELLGDEDRSAELVYACLGQKFMGSAPLVFAWTIVWERSAWKYGERASRYAGLDIGHVCQNVCLAAEAMGLGCCPVGAFLDGPANELLGLDPTEEAVFYYAPVGRYV